jgi:predicted phage tail protein
MTDIPKKIIGARRRRKTPPPPTRTPDTLHSKQFATFLDLISEGEIEGFATASKEGRTQGTTAYNNAALKDVFLNETPVLEASADSANATTADFNFQDVVFNPRFGTADQAKVDGIESSSSVTTVGVIVTNSTPVTRQITNTNVDRINVLITVPQLQLATDKGDILGSEIQYKISVQYNSGGFTDIITDTISGRTADAYQRDYGINLTGDFPVDIRVTRITADSTNSFLQDEFQWTSFSEIIDDANKYPNSAYSALRLDSVQFNAAPSRKFRIRGIKIRIPGAGASGSGTPQVDLQTGRIIYPDGYIFNGVMGAAVWCSCPAMVLLDLLTDTRYGFGDHITDSSLDLFSFVTASKYANTLVDDGLGGQEARFSCNVNIQSPGEAFNLINELSGVMRCMPIWSAGSISITQDKPTDPSYLFTLSNVTEEGFSYSGSSLKTRHSVVSVSYFNMDSQEVDFEVVEDATAISKFGTIVKQVKAFACTSRGQAQRLGKAILFAEQNESEIVVFSTSIDSGAVVRPGAIIQIQDPVRAGIRRGGRLSAVSSTTVVTVDDTSATDLAVDASGNPVGNATLAVILPDGTFESRTISSVSNGVITVSSAFSQAPNVNANFLISNTTTQSQLFRVITVEEQDGINYAITALSYVEGKYAFIEDGEALPARNITNLGALADPPSGLSAAEKIFPINNQAVSKIVVSWQTVVGVTQYQVNYRFGNDNVITERVTRPDFEIMNSRLGTYTIQVFSYNIFEQLSATSTDITFEAVGKTAVPQDVTNLRIEPISDQFVRLRFDKATDIDVIHGGNVVIRSSNLTSGVTFTNAVDVLPALSGNVNETIVPNIVNGTYILKFKDDGGRLSSGEAKVVMLQTVPNALPKLTVLEDREDTDSPPFAGVKDDCFYSSEVNGLVLGSQVKLDSVTDFDAIADFDFLGNVDSETGGQYSFANTLDLGGKQPLRLRRHFVTQGFYPNDLIDKRTANIDTWTDFDGATAFDVGASLLVATTDLDPDLSVSATYGQSATTITITKSSHGYSVGDFVVIDFAAGGATDGNYQIISVPSSSTFTVTSATSATISSGTSCTYGANFSQFNPFVNGTYVARGYKFRADLESSDPAQSIEIDQLGYTAELESRTETSLGNAGASTGGFIASGTSTKSVTFTNSFFTGQSGTSIAANSVLPSIGITIENAQSGDFFALSSISSTGFDIDVKNGSSHVDREFKYTATGFGRGS